MSKPTELQAGALNAWTPAQQAALYHLHVAKQVEADEDEALKQEKEEAQRKARGESGEDVKPEGVEAGKIVNNLVRYHLITLASCAWNGSYG
jgi:hypothetical protein